MASDINTPRTPGTNDPTLPHHLWLYHSGVSQRTPNPPKCSPAEFESPDFVSHSPELKMESTCGIHSDASQKRLVYVYRFGRR